MNKKCRNCKFRNRNRCKENHALLSLLPFKCKFFRCKPYVEKFTKCDKCELLDRCKEDGIVINTQTSEGQYEHYVIGLGCGCKKLMEVHEL